MNSFLTVIIKIQQRSIESHTSFMCDPKTYIFLLQNNLMKNNAIVSGSLVSTTTTNKGEAFLDLDYAWLQSPLLMKEPSATDKMVDLEAALDFNKNYFKSLGNDSLFRKAEQSYERIKELQGKMKRNMPFVYRSR